MLSAHLFYTPISFFIVTSFVAVSSSIRKRVASPSKAKFCLTIVIVWITNFPQTSMFPVEFNYFDDKCTVRHRHVVLIRQQLVPYAWELETDWAIWGQDFATHEPFTWWHDSLSGFPIQALLQRECWHGDMEFRQFGYHPLRPHQNIWVNFLGWIAPCQTDKWSGSMATFSARSGPY